MKVRAGFVGSHIFFSITIFVAVMVGAVPVGAKSLEEPLGLTLKRSIEMALKRNRGILFALDEIEAAIELREEAGTGFLPAFKAKYSYRRTNDVAFASIAGTRFDIEDKDQYRFNAFVEQPLFKGFATLANYELAKLGIDVAKIQLARARSELILNVKEAYIDVLTAEKIRAVENQSVLQLEAQLKVARNFYEVGLSPKVDVLEAEVRLAEAKQKLIRAVNAIRLAKARLNILLREPINHDFFVVDVLAHLLFETSFDVCLDIALKKRPELLEAQKNVIKAEKRITLAKSDYYPFVSLFGNYNRAGDDPTVDGSINTDRENWDIVAQATITFFEWGKTQHSVGEKRLRLRQAKDSLEQVKDSIQLEVRTSYLNLQTAEEYIWVAEKSVALAEENYRLSEERYKQQVVAATEVLDAQTRLTKTKTNHTIALAASNVARARLIRAMGLEDESQFEVVTTRQHEGSSH